MEPNRPNSTAFFVLLFAAGLLVGGLASFYITFQEVNKLNQQVAILQSQISAISGGNATIQNITIIQNATALSSIYAKVRDSVVLVQGETADGDGVQASGFVYLFQNQHVVITNYHVVQDTATLSVTFSDGKGYPATVLGTDPYADLAIVSVTDAPATQFKPVQIVNSSTLRVGDQVIAIGNPYGLVGSLTTGVVSAVDRTLTENASGGFSIANVIQTSAPINPGNSGGPLLNALGNVVGITTAIVSESQGLGFAVPSNTILREIFALVTSGSYSGHSYLGVTGRDMDYQIAQQLEANVTYGWRIEIVVSGGPSDGKIEPGDIIIALDGNLIRNNDDLASYLEEHTLPTQNIDITIVRENTVQHVTVTLGVRPEVT